MNKLEISRESLDKLVEANDVIAQLKTKLENMSDNILKDLSFVEEAVYGLINDQVVQYQFEQEIIYQFFSGRDSKFKKLQEEYYLDTYWDADLVTDMKEVAGILNSITINGVKFDYGRTDLYTWLSIWLNINDLVKKHIKSNFVYIEDIKKTTDGDYDVRISYL